MPKITDEFIRKQFYKRYRSWSKGVRLGSREALDAMDMIADEEPEAEPKQPMLLEVPQPEPDSEGGEED